MKFAALVRDTLLEIRASRLMIFFALFAAAVLLVEYFVLGRGGSFHMSVNGKTSVAQGGAQIAATFLPVLAAFLATVLGLFTLFGMSDVMTPVLTRGTAEIYLSKPIPRWFLLLARVAGHLLAMAIAAALTFAGVFLIAGLRAGVWDARLFLAIGPLLLNVAVYLALLTLFNVLTTSAGLSGLLAFGTLVLASVLRYHEALARLFDNAAWSTTVETLYILWPKFQEVEDGIRVILGAPQPFPWFAVGTTAAFGVAAVGAAMAVFARKDY